MPPQDGVLAAGSSRLTMPTGGTGPGCLQGSNSASPFENSMMSGTGAGSGDRLGRRAHRLRRVSRAATSSTRMFNHVVRALQPRHAGAGDPVISTAQYPGTRGTPSLSRDRTLRAQKNMGGFET